MNIVTTGNSSFFHCLQKLTENVKEIYDKKAIVYDVGLTSEERNSLDADVIQLNVDVSFSKYTTVNNVPFIQATHKPYCIKHYFEHYSEPAILVDADCLFMERVEEHGFDIGVTLKPRRGIDTSDHYSGVLNSGVVFFNTNAQELIKKWIDECRKPDTTDQKALTDLLSETIDWKQYDKIYDWHGLRIKVFRTEQYNDYYLKSGKILHFKGERHRKDIYKQLTDSMEQNIDIYRLFRKLMRGEKKSFLNKITKRLFPE